VSLADHDRAGALVLVGGHESAGGDALPSLDGHPGLHGPAPVRTGAGRPLERALARVLRERPAGRPVVVVPMTLGRDPRLVSDTARTVRWAAREQPAGALALAPPFGTADHLVSWLRAACRRLGDEDAVLIAAEAADPFDDAELHRVAALVRTYGGGRLVEVGLHGPDGRGLDAGVDRCRRLGAVRVAILPADFAPPPGAAAPLLSTAAIAPIVADRVATACHRLAHHGDDGVMAAHGADHQHGFAHSHDHDHPDAHPQAHGHDHLAVG
jgi:sirohydrochlorin cobaltochelatase